MWQQIEFSLAPKKRGFHLITDEILNNIPEINTLKVGIVHLFIQHSSASLTINENADPTVRTDMEKHINVMVPEDAPYYEHTYEGSDDMPAHIKTSLMGNNLTIPITNGSLNMGIWQGIYIGEHRNYASGRNIIATIQGE